MNIKNYVGIGTVVLVSIAVGLFILGSEPRPSASIHDGHGHGAQDPKDGVRKEHGHDGKGHSDHHDHDGSGRGPHGGRLFAEGDFEVEVVIFEEGVPPRFRVYCYEEHKPVDPREVSASIELNRLGDRVTLLAFEPRGDFLHSDTVVEEPHSFDARVVVQHEGKTYEWEFSQIEGRVKVVPEVAETVGIVVESAGVKRIRSVLELPGEVVLNADRVCHVVPRVSGVISQCRKNLGDRVKAGEVVAVIESRELAEVGGYYLVRYHRDELARINYERTKRLWQDKVSPEKEFLDAEKAMQEAAIELLAAERKLRALGLSGKDIQALHENPEASMTGYSLRAPFDGEVITKHMSPGEWVEEKADILGIADLSTVWVDITVYADSLDGVRVGQKVLARSNAGDHTAEGVISYFGPIVGEKSRTAKARVVLDNSHGKWRPGMFVTVTIIREETEVPVAVKPGAIQTLDRFGEVVFVRYGDHFEVRPITLGRSDSEYVEVVTGLSAGENYASAKSFLIKSELAKGGLSHTH